ncbi:MAG TPA: glycyl radical protein [Bacillota bacterium]|jgi:pyruvate formate-lyase/glycerol dehydratase family glycyl radical enzyme|nr:glycyl radical protein [Fastidiosipila sp.]HPX93323.1 glycyl radical protein [Bacillota bacterium]HQB80982.1 glycyl radical protein [Bacillota bacterium]
MEKRGMNERIQKLRDVSVSTQPVISMERAQIETEVYKKYQGQVSAPVLRALFLKELMEKKVLYLGEDELIVGEKGEHPQAAPTFPELCCHTLEDMEVMDRRELISFKVKEDYFAIQEKTIIPYWDARSTRTIILNKMTEEWKDAYRAGIFTEFMEQRGPGHTVGADDIYARGFNDRIAQIDRELQNLDYLTDPEAPRKAEQLKGMRIACEAIIALGRRYSDYAAELAAREENPERKKELLQISKNCEVVPAEKPQTFWQAIQMYWFVHLGVTLEINPWDAFSPGRLDQHLIPFYRKDLEDGILDDTRAKELLQALWVKFNNQPAPPKVGITLKESSTYTDFANINTGGITPNGQDGVNEVSYLILDTMEELRLLQPSSNVQISRKTPDRFLHRACEIARQGWGQPAFYNTEAIIQELLNAGKSLADARYGGASGCVETGCFGREAYILTGYFNLTKILMLTLNDGFDHYSGKQLGLRTGKAESFKSFEHLMAAYAKQLEYFLDIKIAGSNVIDAIFAEKMPVPFLSAITLDCIGKAKDYNAGGARYNTNYIQGVGIGTVTDSMTALKYHVFEKKSFTVTELMKALEDNFEGHEALRSRLLLKTPKYGNDDDYADRIMRQLFDIFARLVNGRPTNKGGEYRINMLPTTSHVYFGSVIGATPDGRCAHKPLSEGISPVQGADHQGPAAVINSAAKMDHLRTGGTLLNQKFTPSLVKGENGLNMMGNLVRTYFDKDGHHIQFNVIDKETLLAAQKKPEEYRDLIVRVAGYSDYFRNLDQELQNEIIARTEQEHF